MSTLRAEQPPASFIIPQHDEADERLLDGTSEAVLAGRNLGKAIPRLMSGRIGRAGGLEAQFITLLHAAHGFHMWREAALAFGLLDGGQS